jgi:hypothetical protein
MVSEPDVSSLNLDMCDLLKKIKINYSILLSHVYGQESYT